MLRSAFVFCVAILGLSALGTEAHRSSSAIANDRIEIKEILSGQVIFEKRSTIVAMDICENAPCRRSQPYWAIVILQGDIRFEVDEVFAAGRSEAPETLELAGTIVRPGSFLEVEGSLRLVSAHYGIISGVIRATELQDQVSAILPTPILVEGLPNRMSWMCQSPDGSTPKMYIGVRYLFGPKNHVTQHIMTIAMARVADDLSYYPLADLENVDSQADESRIIYTGESEEFAAALTIEKTAEKTFNLPSALLLAHTKDELTIAGKRKIYPVTCTQTRL